LAPAALAAVYIRPATLQIQPPPGGIYAGQCFHFERPTTVGDTLTTGGEIEELFVKKDNRFVVMRTETRNQAGERVSTGWSTRIWSQ